MLNIGLLAPGAGEYYIGEVASSAEDYYTGHGESAGRWVGSLAREIGLASEADPEHFRAVLAGRDPFSGEQLIHRKAARSEEAPSIEAERTLDVAQAAAFLGVSGRYVRRLLRCRSPAELPRQAPTSPGQAGPPSPCVTARRPTTEALQPESRRSGQGGRLGDTIAWCCGPESRPELMTLAKTLPRWLTEILARHHTRASKGPNRSSEPAHKRREALGSRDPQRLELPAPHRPRRRSKPAA